MIQDGAYMNLGEPIISQKEQSMRKDKFKIRASSEGLLVVGLTDSTRSIGKLCTGGSGQQWNVWLSTSQINT